MNSIYLLLFFLNINFLELFVFINILESHLMLKTNKIKMVLSIIRS